MKSKTLTIDALKNANVCRDTISVFAAPALAEYKKVEGPALAEYKKVTAAAWASLYKSEIVEVA